MAPFLPLTVIALVITTATTVTAYANYTVGGPAGWLFDPVTNKSSANYATWAANKTFNLGDFLIFNTNSNVTVILTYNVTTYRSCSIDNSSDTDTFYFGQGTEQVGEPSTVSVPLTIEGSNYFFSDAYDGVQCENGMAFGVNVSHGVGLPPSLNQPPPPPYVESPSNADGSITPPTIGNQPSGAGLRGTANVVSCALTLFGIFVLVHV